MTFRLLIFFVLWLVFPGKSNLLVGQKFHTIRQAEDSLSAILATLNRATDDSTRNAINLDFKANLYSALILPNTDNYEFDSLKTLVKLTSPDNNFRFFNWNLPSDNGKHRFYGFLKIFGKDAAQVYPLTDISDSLPDPDTIIAGPTEWFGALYYKVIPCESASGQKYYTLLGWSGQNNVISRKVIEILSFDTKGTPHFGMKVFPGYKEGNMKRIIFRFAATTTMFLKFERQPVETKKGWNPKTKAFDSVVTETPMIVFDRLVPLDPQLEGQYQFYVPAGELSDGFIFTKHYWTFTSGIDSRNKKK